jgi:O-antigen/teichoic acid export membrane protein
MSLSTNHYSSSKVKKGVVHFLTGKGITAVASFAVAILLIRELSIQNYAAYTALSALLLFMMLLTNLGLERVVPKYIPPLKIANAYSELFVFSVKLLKIRFFSLLLSIIPLGVFSSFIFGWLNIDIDNTLLVYFSIYLVGFGLSMHLMRMLQALLEQKQAMFGMAVEWFSKLLGLISILYVYEDLNLALVFILQAVTVWLGVLYLSFILFNKLRIKVEKNYGVNVLDCRQVFNFGMDNYLQTLLGFHTLPSTSKLLGASFLASPALAGLGFAYAITGVFKRYLPANLLLGLVEPVIMARYTETNDFKKTVKIVGLILKLNLFIIIPASIWILFNGEGLINLISKDKYGDSYWLVSSLLFILVLESQRSVLQLISNAVDQSRLLLLSNIWSLVGVPFWLLSTYAWGISGLITGLILILMFRNIFLSRRLSLLGFDFKTDWKSIILILVSSILASVLSYFIGNVIDDYLLGLLATIVSFISIYLTMNYLFKPFSKEERKTLNNFIGKKIFVW